MPFEARVGLVRGSHLFADTIDEPETSNEEKLARIVRKQIGATAYFYSYQYGSSRYQSPQNSHDDHHSSNHFIVRHDSQSSETARWRERRHAISERASTSKQKCCDEDSLNSNEELFSLFLTLVKSKQSAIAIIAKLNVTIRARRPTAIRFPPALNSVIMTMKPLKQIHN